MTEPMPEWMQRRAKHLRPEDAELVRGYDPLTAGLVLLQLGELREMFAILFPALTTREDQQ